MLRASPPTHLLPALYDEAFLAWQLQISSADRSRAKLVEKMLSELVKTDLDDTLDLLKCLQKELFDVGKRAETPEQNAREVRDSKPPELFFAEHLRLYKQLFENEFRLWSTVPYLFVCRTYGVATRGTTSESFVRIGSSAKYHGLSNLKVALPFGDPTTLLKGFNNEIRNAGEGHDDWEIADDETLRLHIIDPKTGLLKGRGHWDFKREDLLSIIKDCRQSLWALRVGVMLFVCNNQSLCSNLGQLRVRKTSEARAYVEQFARDRWFTITQLRADDARTNIYIALQLSPVVLGEMARVYFGNGESYDLARIDEQVAYDEQVVGIIQYLLTIFAEETRPPKLEIRVSNEAGQQIASVTYAPSEVHKIFSMKTGSEPPTPTSGTLPDGCYTISYRVRVPLGMREVVEQRFGRGRQNHGL